MVAGDSYLRHTFGTTHSDISSEAGHRRPERRFRWCVSNGMAWCRTPFIDQTYLDNRVQLHKFGMVPLCVVHYDTCPGVVPQPHRWFSVESTPQCTHYVCSDWSKPMSFMNPYTCSFCIHARLIVSTICRAVLQQEIDDDNILRFTTNLPTIMGQTGRHSSHAVGAKTILVGNSCGLQALSDFPIFASMDSPIDAPEAWRDIRRGTISCIEDDLVLVRRQCPWLVRCCPTRSCTNNDDKTRICPPLPTPRSHNLQI